MASAPLALVGAPAPAPLDGDALAPIDRRAELRGLLAAAGVAAGHVDGMIGPDALAVVLGELQFEGEDGADPGPMSADEIDQLIRRAYRTGFHGVPRARACPPVRACACAHTSVAAWHAGETSGMRTTRGLRVDDVLALLLGSDAQDEVVVEDVVVTARAADLSDADALGPSGNGYAFGRGGHGMSDVCTIC
jgi:hypothetical protein